MAYENLLSAVILGWGAVCFLVGRMALITGRERPTPQHSALAIAAKAAADAHAAGLSGDHVFSMACAECGSRQVPPTAAIPSPLMPWDEGHLVDLGDGFVVTATCRRCGWPIMSRRMNADEAASARALGVKADA